MNQSSFDPGRPKSRPYDYDSATGQSKPAPNPEFEEIFRRAKQHQQQIRRQQNQALTGRQPTQSFDPLPFPPLPNGPSRSTWKRGSPSWNGTPLRR